MYRRQARKFFKTVTAFMKRHGRLVSAVVLATRYGMGDMVCQYVEVNSELAKQRGLVLPRESSGVGLDLDNLLFSADAGMAMVAECQSCEVGGSAELEELQDPATTAKRGFIKFTEFLDHWDMRRTASFVFFGVMYFGFPGFGHVIYTKILPRLFPTRPMAAAVFDAGLCTNLVYMPLFYLTMKFWSDDFLGSKEHPEAKTLTAEETVKTALAEWRGNVFEDVKLTLAVWVPFHFLNFKFFPVFMRTSVLAVQGIVWVALLSHMRGGHGEESDGEDTSATANFDQHFNVDVNVVTGSQPPLDVE